jgi:hypothetical protein
MFILNARRALPGIMAAMVMFAAMSTSLSAQTISMPAADNFTLPTTQACSNQLGVAKPKVYIANFLVTYGKKTMGRLIADNIAFRFENDERFELISRKTVDKEMSPMFKKTLKGEEYLNLAISLAAQHQADCVIFGKIGKKGSKISFLVRMAAVATGENKIKVDEDVDKKEASAFFERTGDSLISYFSAAPVIAAPVEAPKTESSKAVLMFWGGYNFFQTDSQSQRVIDIMKTIPSSTSELGGISGGADLWIRLAQGVDLGFGVAYISIWKYKYTYVSGGNTLGYDVDVKYLPITAQIRFISGVGLYLAGGAGYYTSLADENLTVNGTKVTATSSASSFGVNGSVGWQIKLGSSATMDLGAKFWYPLENGGGYSITPFGGFGFRF